MLSKGLETINKNLGRMLKKEIINETQLSETLNNISTTTELNQMKDRDLIIEAVTENLDVKNSIFAKLDNITEEQCILASNTSSISINELADNTKRPSKVIGMHFMNPVPLMKLVEIIKTERTSSETLELIKQTAINLKKEPIECLDSPGFISNRILIPMINEAIYTLMEGVATKESIDSIMKLGMAHPMGPLALADLIGLDVCLSIMNVLKDGFNGNPKYEPCPLLVQMCKKGKLGRKTGEGFYKY
jgi:3-hydroxybutyryl-CoA dehydrogenase